MPENGALLHSACLAGVARQSRESGTCWLWLGFALSRSAVILSDDHSILHLEWHKSSAGGVTVVLCDISYAYGVSPCTASCVVASYRILELRQDVELESLKTHRCASDSAAPAPLLTILHAHGRGCNPGGDCGRIAVGRLSASPGPGVAQAFSTWAVHERRDRGATA